MDIINEVVLNIVLVLFPILIFFIFSCYKNLHNKRHLKASFYIAIYTSIYLIFNYSSLDITYMLLVLNIPIIACYIRGEDKFALLLSLLIILLLYNSIIELIYLFIKYILFYLVYNKIKNINRYIEVFAIISAFCLSLEYFLYYHNTSVIDGAKIYLCMFIFYLVSLVVLYLFKLAGNITDMYSFIKDLEKDKELKNSLFKLTHEIKNPLAVCKGYLDMIDITNEDKASKYINIIQSEIERSLSIMNSFSLYSKLSIKKEDMDVNILLDDVYEGFKILLNNNNIKFKYLNSDEDKYIYGDYEKLKQVMLNILKNSMESIDGKGNIKLECYKDNKYIIIKVKDDGIGMDKDTLSKIKTIFYTTKKNGNGIGVSLSNEIVKGHNGDLIYNSILGKGTDVTIKLLV